MSWYNPFSWKIDFNAIDKANDYFIPENGKFYTVNGKDFFLDLENTNDYKVAYNICAPLKSIINRRANMFVAGEVQILNKNNDNTKRGPKARLLKEKLQRPNVLQSWKQFYAQFHIYTDLYGFCPVLKVTPKGMSSISSLWCLPPDKTTIEYTGKFMNQTSLKGIYKSIKFHGKELDLDNVALIMDIGISEGKNGELIPDSRVKSQEFAISNIVATDKSLNTIISKKGALGILSNESKDSIGQIAVGEDEKKALQSDFARYGLTGQEWQIIITDANLKWQNMSYPVKEMAYFETMDHYKKNLCDGIGMYDYIMSNGKGTTFSNLNEAKKAQYQDFIIPDSEARLEQLSDFIIPKEENSYLWVDFSHLEIFQESKKEKAEGLKAQAEALEMLWNLGLVKRNDMLFEMERDIIQGRDEFEKYKFELEPEIDPNNPINKKDETPPKN